MIIELGHFALVLALLLAVVQGVLPLVGAQRGDAAWMEAGRMAALGQLPLVAIAFAALMHAYVVSDFSVVNVVQNSHSAKPLLYKITGVWGNHEGSMLLWVLILALFGAAVAAFGDNLPETLRARVLGIQGLLCIGFLLFILATSNPFLRAWPPPLDGQDLNPLLQDPGLAFHPPFLYLGYVGFSIAFSFAVAALLEGRVDAAWARWVRPWTLAAWVSLTIGIALGSWWAYYELGWGGWWFWDPVENASLMPWLVGTALLHSAIVVEKREALKVWTVLLAILTFGLSLIGTFLVRSGVLNSVHAFATDPQRGLFILALLAVALGGGLLLFALRAHALAPGGRFAPVSREGALVLNNLLLSVVTATVFIGTLYPLLLDALGGGTISVGPPYFDRTVLPVMVPLLIAAAIGPLLAWKRGEARRALRSLWPAGAAALIAAVASAVVSGGEPVLAPLGMALAAWLLVGTLVELTQRLRLFRIPLADSARRAAGLPRAAYGMSLAHGGLAIAVAGMVASSAWPVERIAALPVGGAVDLAGYVVSLDAVESVDGPNYQARRATLTARRGNGPAAPVVATLTPETRVYPVAGMNTTEAAIRTNLLGDLYAVIGDPGDDGTWVVRLHFNPLVPWIWIGCLIMAAGGLVSLTDRRLRVGAPGRRPAVAALAQ